MRAFAGLLCSFLAGLLVAVAAGCSGSTSDEASPDLPLRVVRDVPLPGGTTRLDYQDLDPASHRLYVAHLGDGTVHVLDTSTLDVVATIEGLDEVHGLRLAPDLDRLYASATGSDEVASIDTRTNQVIARVPTDDFPDGIAYDPDTGKVYVSSAHGRAETVVDGRTGQPLGSIDLGGGAGNSVYDPSTKHVLVNVQDRGHIAVIDPTTDTIVDTIDTPGCDANHGLYVDSEHQLGFVACEGNATLLTIDLRTGQLVDSRGVGDTPDVLAYDYGLGRLYVASESGTVTILDVRNGQVRTAGQAHIADSAHTIAVDPVTHRVFLPLEDVGGHPVVRVMEPTDR
jgi:YVTN family beta-propeller protein